MILNLSEAPRDAAERLVWLTGVKQAALTELDLAYAETYATLRREGRFEWAVAQKFHGKKKALAYTRMWNRLKGGLTRWNDGLDLHSTNYRGY